MCSYMCVLHCFACWLCTLSYYYYYYYCEWRQVGYYTTMGRPTTTVCSRTPRLAVTRVARLVQIFRPQSGNPSSTAVLRCSLGNPTQSGNAGLWRNTRHQTTASSCQWLAEPWEYSNASWLIGLEPAPSARCGGLIASYSRHHGRPASVGCEERRWKRSETKP